jgi:hypothetical protein
VPDAPEARPDDAPVVVWLDSLPAVAIGAAFVAIALAAYWLPGSIRFYNHFVWQAMAFLQGQAAIPWPVPGTYGVGGNEWMQDVYPIRGPGGSMTGFALLPFPPLPAFVLMPFVAIWGLATDIRAVSVVFGSIGVGLAWWMLGRLPLSRTIRLATTAFFAFGTVFWYAAQLGTTWFFAHVIAVDCLLLAIGVALGGDPAPDAEVDDLPDPGSLLGAVVAALRRPAQLLDARQVAAGLLFGLACTARLSVVFGAPFFLFVGSGGTWFRRGLSAALGAALPIGGLLAYNLATTGQLIHPGYDYQYHLEAIGYPGLHYNPAWSLEDIRYLPQNIGIMFLNTPILFPDHVPSAVSAGRALCTEPGAVRSLFDSGCPLALPDDVGTSILLSSPGYLLMLPALLGARSRLVAGAFLAVIAIAIFNLMHFSQGWVQFGYRFSNDFAPFAIVLVAVGLARRRGVGILGVGLIGISIAANLWGVIWGNILGW